MPRKRSLTKDIERHALQGDKEQREDEHSRLFLPTGSTLLNLAVSDRAEDGGWMAGKIVNLVGDSNTGKTLVAMTGLMEMSLDPCFDEYQLVYDDVEHALEMDIPGMYGPQLAERLQDPYGHHWGDEEWQNSDNIEEVRNHVCRLAKTGKPFIYILDSYDALTSREEMERQEKENTGTETKRDYPRGPTILSELFRKVKRPLDKFGSLLLIISQTRDVMDAISFGAQKRRAGGKALKFYSSHEVWLAMLGAIKKEVRGIKYEIGHNVRAKSTRSKATGKGRTVDFTVYTKYGVDDIDSCVGWLLSTKTWTGTGKAINSKGFAPVMSRAELVSHIEKSNKAGRLRRVVQAAWDVMEAQVEPDRVERWKVR